MTPPHAAQEPPAQQPPAEPARSGSASVIDGGQREHTPHVPSQPAQGTYLKPRHLVMMALGYTKVTILL